MAFRISCLDFIAKCMAEALFLGWCEIVNRLKAMQRPPRSAIIMIIVIFLSDKTKRITTMENKHRSRITTTTVIFTVLGILFVGARGLAAESGKTDCCSQMTAADAARILDISVDDLQTSSSDLMVSPEDQAKKIYKVPPCRCSIRSRSNFLKSITYVIYVYNDAGQAGSEYGTMKNGFESVARVDIVPNIGEATFWVGDSRFQRMVALKGALVVDVLSPKELELQKQIMARLMGQ